MQFSFVNHKFENILRRQYNGRIDSFPNHNIPDPVGHKPLGKLLILEPTITTAPIVNRTGKPLHQLNPLQFHFNIPNLHQLPSIPRPQQVNTFFKLLIAIIVQYLDKFIDNILQDLLVDLPCLLL